MRRSTLKSEEGHIALTKPQASVIRVENILTPPYEVANRYPSPEKLPWLLFRCCSETRFLFQNTKKRHEKCIKKHGFKQNVVI